MQKHFFHVSLALLIIFIGFMGFSVIYTKAQESSGGFYDNPKMSLEQVMFSYHGYVNKTFNENIKLMLKSLEKDIGDENGKPLENAEECANHPENFSTYCLSVKLLGDENISSSKGYLNYRDALIARRSQISDASEKPDTLNKVIDATTIGAENTANSERTYQVQKALVVSSRIDAIDREITTSKEALDKTLAAYDQLRMAWPMHKGYVKIYNALTIYRDKLSELRHQTDTFPGRFIDVTSTQCT